MKAEYNKRGHFVISEVEGYAHMPVPAMSDPERELLKIDKVVIEYGRAFTRRDGIKGAPVITRGDTGRRKSQSAAAEEPGATDPPPTPPPAAAASATGKFT
jgi:hypothetical protein